MGSLHYPYYSYGSLYTIDSEVLIIVKKTIGFHMKSNQELTDYSNESYYYPLVIQILMYCIRMLTVTYMYYRYLLTTSVESEQLPSFHSSSFFPKIKLNLFLLLASLSIIPNSFYFL